MINLLGTADDNAGEFSPAALKRLWFWAPIAAGGALALVLMLAIGLPQTLEIRRLLNHLQELEQHRQELALLRLQAAKNAEESKRVGQQGEQLMQLVTGRGDLATVLATLDLEANQSQVELQLYEPLAAGGKADPRARTPAAPPPPPPAPGGAAPAAGGLPLLPPGNRLPGDPMSRAGLRERSLVLVARGTYPQLLDFLRRVEALDVLVEQKDLSLSVREIQPGASASQLPSSTPIVDMRLSLTLWSKDGKEEAAKPAAGTAPPPPVPPAAPVPPAPPG